jgi:hypothetical protein
MCEAYDNGRLVHLSACGIRYVFDYQGATLRPEDAEPAAAACNVLGVKRPRFSESFRSRGSG